MSQAASDMPAARRKRARGFSPGAVISKTCAGDSMRKASAFAVPKPTATILAIKKLEAVYSVARV